MADFITRDMRRRKRKATNDVAAALIKLNAALQDMQDSTDELKRAYLSACHLDEAAKCDVILRWLTADEMLRTSVNGRRVKDMLDRFNKLNEEL